MAGIEIVVQMSSFHFRFHWMLSSLVQQAGDIPSLSIRVDTHSEDPYKQKTRGLIDAFGGLLDISWIEHGRRFASRGLLRSDAMAESSSEWLLFSDADMLYPPRFFEGVAGFIGEDNKDAILSVGRLRTTREAAAEAIRRETYAAPIEKSYDKALAAYDSSPWRTSAARATGYFQLCNRRESMALGSYTQDKPTQDRPLKGTGGGETFSDVQFRLGRRIVDMKLSPLVHLTHPRRWKNEWNGECL